MVNLAGIWKPFLLHTLAHIVATMEYLCQFPPLTQFSTYCLRTREILDFPKNFHPTIALRTAELWDRFGISDRRREILNGYLELRRKLLAINITGFQWLGGSFMENIEAQQTRDPNDLDVVTFVATPAEALSALVTENPWLVDNREIKARYAVDHFLVPLTADPILLVDLTRYWYGLFSHRRDGIWKGMLTIVLDSLMVPDEPRRDSGDEP